MHHPKDMAADLLAKLTRLLRQQRIALASATTLLVVGTVIGSLFLLTPPGRGEKVVLADFAKGGSLKRFAEDLEKKRVIRSQRLFVLYARLGGDASRLQAGTYRFTDGLSPAEIIREMARGEVYEQRFALPEGYSIYQVAELLEGRKLFTRERFLAACSDGKLLTELKLPGKSVEGYLYPSTYGIRPGMDEAATIRAMVGAFRKSVGEMLFKAPVPAGLTRHQIVILASVVEKEAVVAGEQPLIASVFLNRLRKGMPLQSDPTAVYGVRAFAGKVRKADIQRENPYNTYLIKGLPPGPIGNPSASAIKAVLQPATSPYLYFVARNDGTHQFSTTLEEHNRAVSRYLKGKQPVAEIRNDNPNIAGRRR
ncbi:endolytic transglycosylase MltG [Geobacter argillaceus]|uniref:Endolytic murein transglycosylase n=1 Tax=Geobacter argillaceus TaxID=345631 RepID=A0A562WS34_9BACT|nr:endolytic transglycosylase MltG [Geobacter argillaceus]TWJ33394.1 UPF0755 protein [Geobacter argillaceus]